MYSSLMLSKRDFSSMVYQSKLAMRYGITDLLGQVRQNHVPFVVVSGGIKEVIDCSFYELIRGLEENPRPYNFEDYHDLRHSYNLDVVSNTFNYVEKTDEKTG